MGRKKQDEISCGFEIIADTREQLPYAFNDLWDGPTGRSCRLIVPVRREKLDIGDYAVFGYPRGAVERKSKQDLYSSISQSRDNFIRRLERMSDECDFAAVVVESEWSELLTDPPPFTDYNPKSLSRTIQAWITRYKVHWIMAPGRRGAEAFTFRLLERFWKDRQESKS